MPEPRTDEEWKEAAEEAWFWWRFSRAQRYGLVKGGPAVDEEQCRETLLRAQTRGINPETRDLEKVLFGG